MRSVVHSYHSRGLKLVAGASIAVVTAVVAACASDGAKDCRVGADCASGVCSADGTCTVATGPGVDASGGVDANGSNDSAAPVSDAGNDVTVTGCVPNKDGTITRDEVPIAAGLHATYAIGTNESVSTAGTTGPGGLRTWDFSAKLASDTTVIVETQALTGKWYESAFAGATYASKLSQSSDLIGVFETSPGALLLRGVVSPDDTMTTKTELTNTPGVSVLKFPLTMGATWTSAVKVGGTASGVTLLTTYDETYVSKVDAAGTLKAPLGTFDVLRVQVVLTRQIGVLPATTIRTFAFVTECYGTIATITSANDETNEEFTTAAEIRRISP